MAIWNPAWNLLKSMKIFPLAPVWAGSDSRGPVNKNIHDNIIKTSSLKGTKLRSHRWPKLLYFLMGLSSWFCSLKIFNIAVLSVLLTASHYTAMQINRCLAFEFFLFSFSFNRQQPFLQVTMQSYFLSNKSIIDTWSKVLQNQI